MFTLQLAQTKTFLPQRKGRAQRKAKQLLFLSFFSVLSVREASGVSIFLLLLDGYPNNLGIRTGVLFL